MNNSSEYASSSVRNSSTACSCEPTDSNGLCLPDGGIGWGIARIIVNIKSALVK